MVTPEEKHPVDFLVEEHEVILQVLTAIRRKSAGLRQGQPIAERFWLGIVDFLRNFAERMHQAREEGVLYPALAAHGFSEEQGPIAVMKAEHDEGRELVQQLADAIDEGSTPNLVQAARALVEHFEPHIRKENEVLFVLVRQQLPPEAATRLRERFEHEAEAVLSASEQREYLRLARRLCEGAGVTLHVPPGLRALLEKKTI